VVEYAQYHLWHIAMPSGGGVHPIGIRAPDSGDRRGARRAQTVLQCYQRADEDKLRKALAQRRDIAS
jgi:hypothetical protein